MVADRIVHRIITV